MKANHPLNQDVLSFFGLLIVIFLGVSIFAFVKPLTQSVTVPLEFTHHGIFDYSASVPSELYNGGEVTAGEPLFRNVVSAFSVSFTYALETSEPVQINGVYQMMLEVSEPGGWKRTYPLQEASQFRDTAFTTTSLVDFSQVEEIIHNFEELTLVHRNEYSLEIFPQVFLTGQVDGIFFEDQFMPRLEFGFTDTAVEFHGARQEINNLFQPTSAFEVQRQVEQPTTLNLLGWEIPIKSLRVIGVFGLTASSAVLGVLIWLAYRPIYWAKSILYNNEDEISPITFLNFKSPQKRLVEIDSLRDISLIAEREQQKITHIVLGNNHHFFVLSSHFGNVMYHFERPVIQEEAYPLEAANLKR